MTTRTPESLHETIRLYIGPDAYTFEPASNDPQEKGETLTIDRRTYDISLNSAGRVVPSSQEKVLTTYGLLGIISLSTTDFLIVITGRQHAGTIRGHAVYRATEFKLFPFDRLSTTRQLLKHPVEGILLGLVKAHLDSGRFYFTHGFDITSNVQRQRGEAGEGKAVWERADDRFFWNRHLQSKLIGITSSNPSQDLSRFILPVIYGFLEIKQTTLLGRPLTLALIARRSRFRAGTRYFSRGIDPQGNVSNFNETEQLAVVGDDLWSHVQIRGSVPVFWSEINTLRYRPDLQIMELPSSTEAVRMHLSNLLSNYGAVTCINLVNQHGYEKPVKEAFETALKNIKHPNVDYEYFDFHAECSKMRWHRIQILIDRLEETLLQQKYFHETPSGEVKSKQSSVVRTNCMDCLDRTNVVQSAIAKWVLTRQLREAGILREGDAIEHDAAFVSVFRNIWADHADGISTTYSGTGALKTDFTRTGTRTKMGALADLTNSITRYIKNNYLDGPRQDAFDLMMGAWVPRRNVPFPLMDERALAVRAVPYVLAFSLFMIVSALVLPRTHETSLRPVFILFTILFFLAAFYMLQNGVEYVAWPRLNPPHEVLSYEGPGFRSPRHGRGWAMWGGLIPAGTRGMGEKVRRKVGEIEMGLGVGGAGEAGAEKKRSD